MMSLVFKFLKYCFVGFTGMAIDFSITWLLLEKVKTNRYVANSTGFIAAAVSNYFLNKGWTFHSESDHIIFEFSSFIVIALIGLVINNLVLFMLNEKQKLNFYLSKFIAIGVVTFWNFFMNYFFTFSVK